MNTEPSGTVGAVVAWIEQHLDDPLTLEAIARRAGYSPFHFSRLFHATTRRSVMAHVRGRRLVRAARRPLAEPDLRLVDLALASGFDSQQAFTRAFGQAFGTSPGRFREGFALKPLEGQFPVQISSPSRTAVTLLPDRARRDRFTVTGPARRFDAATKAAIPQLWSRLLGSLPLPGQRDGRAAYGVVSALDRAEGSFRYLAGVEVDGEGALPAGFETVTLEPASYAVFRIVLDGGPVHPQVEAAMTEIWGRLVPASGLHLAEGPDFERYSGDAPPTEAGAIIDLHIPVEA